MFKKYEKYIMIFVFMFLIGFGNVYGFKKSDCDKIPETIAFIGGTYKLILIGVPILVVVFGIIDFAKAIISQKDDDMKKSMSNFIKRLVIACVIIFVPTIIFLILKLVNMPGWHQCIKVW